MKKLWKRLSQGKRRGQSLLVIVAALPLIVGGLALVLDVANLYFNQLEMQCASDSAVLACGEYLPSYPSQAISTATSYAETNGLKASEIVSVTVTPDNKEVIIRATKNIPCFFCAVLGESTAHAQVSSLGQQWKWSNNHGYLRDRSDSLGHGDRAELVSTTERT